MITELHSFVSIRTKVHFLVQTSIQRPMNLNLFRGERIGSLIPVSPAPEAPNAYKLRAYACSIEDRPNEIRSESVF